MTLTDKTIFIIGGSRGIGLAMAPILSSLPKPPSRTPSCPERSTPPPKRLSAPAGPHCHCCSTFATGPRSATRWHARAQRFGGIDACINNASAINLSKTETIGAKRFDLIQQINVRGTFLVSRACIPFLRQSANPHILTLSPPTRASPRLVRTAPGLFDVQIWYVYGHARSRRGTSQRRHRLQRIVAAHHHRHRRGGIRA